MAEVTRFPHYHQAENVVTNHVMVMLRTLYDASPKLLEALLRALCADEITVGPASRNRSRARTAYPMASSYRSR